MYKATHSKPVAYLQQGISPAKYLLCPGTKRAEPIQINGSIISRPRLCPASCLLEYVESSYSSRACATDSCITSVYVQSISEIMSLCTTQCTEMCCILPLELSH